MTKYKMCAKCRCKNLVVAPKRYCVAHIELEEKENQARNNYYDKKIRQGKDKKYTEFYHSIEWKKTKALALSVNYGLCQHCLKNKKIKTAEMVHHIIPIKEDWNKRLELSNLIALCNQCHNSINH